MSNYLRSRLSRTRTRNNSQPYYIGYDMALDGSADVSKVIVYDYRNSSLVDEKGIIKPTVTVMDTQLALALSNISIVNGQYILKDERRGD